MADIITYPISDDLKEAFAEAADPTKAPIDMDYSDIIYKQVEDEHNRLILKAVQDVGVKVNFNELMRALTLDKKVREGKLIEPIRCEHCKHSRKCITGGYRCRLWMITRMADDFCSEAKRREKTDEGN